MYIYDNISLNSSYNGTFLCKFMIISRWIRHRMGHFYVRLWQYLAEFVIEWDISMYIYDNISLNSSYNGTFLCMFMTTSRWIRLRMGLRTELFWTTSQRIMVITYRRFGITSWSHLPAIFIDSWPFKMGPIGCTEISVRNYRYSLRNNPEGLSSHLLRGGSLKSHTDQGLSRKIVTANGAWQISHWNLQFYLYRYVVEVLIFCLCVLCEMKLKYKQIVQPVIFMLSWCSGFTDKGHSVFSNSDNEYTVSVRIIPISQQSN